MSQLTNQESPYQVNEFGYYGQFGGAFIPEMLHPNIEELQINIGNTIHCSSIPS